MSKRGMLLVEETLKMVIAVIALGFLVYFLVSLYFTNINENKLKQAQENLDRMGEIISGLNDSETHTLPNPEGWYLFGFIDTRPDSCSGKNCLCICDKNYKPWSSQEEECIEDGKCLIVSNLKNEIEIEIRDPDSLTRVLIKKEEGLVSVTEVK